jgi:putative ABC transport system permease protein
LPANPQLYRPLDQSAQPVPLPERGLLLSQSLAEKLRLRPGDVIRLRPLIGARREVVAPVVGTVDALLGQPAYARIDYVSRLLGEAWVANEVLLDVDDTQSRRTRDALLDALGRRPQVVGVSERERQLRRLDETFGETMDTILFIEVLFAGLLAFGSLLNNSLVVLSERRREIGTMRVMGYRPGRIARMFATENFLLGAAGILLGLPVGIWMTHFLATQYSTDNYRFRAKVEAGDLLETIGIMLIFVALAQLIVTLRIWRSDWLESLKMRE